MTETDTELRRKVLITGGTGDIGIALIKSFVRGGDDVIFQYNKNKDKAEQISRDFGARAVAIDFSSSFHLPSDDIQVLINNAAVNFTTLPVAKVNLEDWERTININLISAIRLCVHYLPSMKKHRYGKIINISSIYGITGSQNNGPYNVSKHGLSGLTKSIAHDYGPHGITANEICPGPVESSLLERVAIATGARSQPEITAYFQELADEIPLRRLASPEDVAACAVFLASEQAAYINGISLPIDGGLIA